MTPLLLAQSTPPPAALASFLEVAFYLVGLFTACLVAYRHLTGKSEKSDVGPQPFIVKSHQEQVTKADLDKLEYELHGRAKRERNEINQQIERVESQQDKRLDTLTEDLKQNTSMTAELRGQFGQMNQNLSTLNAAIQNFLRDAARHK